MTSDIAEVGPEDPPPTYEVAVSMAETNIVPNASNSDDTVPAGAAPTAQARGQSEDEGEANEVVVVMSVETH